uniref:Uncharacterized protein n=1 Tax=Psilocybe cubensis TaxID=181762 RepID=A0A8H8CEZ5_PSICU
MVRTAAAPASASHQGSASRALDVATRLLSQVKLGFLRKAKSVVSSTVAPIIIDKHELHSTWPVYQQPETRHLVARTSLGLLNHLMWDRKRLAPSEMAGIKQS